MNASIRFRTGLMLALVLILGTGCSTLGLSDDCETCDVPAPEPACAPPPVACAPPAATPVAQNRPPATGAAPGQVWCYVKVPAVVQHVPERVCVQQPTTRKEWVAPVQQQVTERVCVRPAATRRVEIPAQYESRAQQICIDPGRTEWAKVECATQGCAKPQEELGECWQLQQVAPTYETKTETICTRPAAFREEVIPGEFADQVKVVTVKPGHYRDVPIAPIYEERVKTVVVSQARWEWRRNNVCEVPGAANTYMPAQMPDSGFPEGMAPAGMAPMAPMAPAPTPSVFEPAPAGQPVVPAPSGNPQGAPTPVLDELPPAGELPPVPTFDDK